jgi:hypothetical protein
MLYPAVAHWNSKCFRNIERRRIQLATTNIIATAIIDLKEALNKELIINLKDFRKDENHALAEIVRYLAEVDSRGSFREAGYSSLSAYE